MKSISTAILVFFLTVQAIAQKKIIDKETFDNWANVQSPAISADGKFVYYTIDKIPKGNHTLVIQSAESDWKKEIVGGNEPQFTSDSKYALYKIAGDSLCILQLGSSQCHYISKVQSYKLFDQKGLGWLGYKLNNEKSQLVLQELKTGQQKLYDNVNDFVISNNGEVMVTNETETLNGKKNNKISWIDLLHNQSQVLWQLTGDKNEEANNFKFDNSGKQLAFTITKTEKNKTVPSSSLWYYKEGTMKAEELVNPNTSNMPAGGMVSGHQFSKDGSRIFLEISQQVKESKEQSGSSVDIWSYKDDKLQAQQLREGKESYVSYKAVYSLNNNNQIVMLSQGNERQYENKFGADDFSIITGENICYPQEAFWRTACRLPLFLLNTITGERKLIKDGLIYTYLNSLSPSNKFFIYYDWESQSYNSYNVATGKTIDPVKNIPLTVYDEEHARAGFAPPFGGYTNWFNDDRHLIIYDQYDIWKVDAAGIEPSVCLTKGYGRKNGIILRLTDEGQLIDKKQILLKGFRPADKANGFLKLDLTGTSNPEMLAFGNYLVCCPYIAGETPKKSANSTTWLVQKMTATEAPNWFVTKDFKSLKQISNVQPQKEYNWLTSELHEWTMFNGKKSQGILYKPENFDPTKKYPVIFHFYEEKSDELNMYMTPEATGSRMNIPYFVSHGYLVFVPDIYYKNGEPVNGIYDAVASAVQYVKKMPFVDSNAVGMQGHSYGAYEVNVLVTKPNLFTAAAEAAGPSDFVSGYGEVLKGGNSNQFQYESGQNRIKATLWEKPELYIKNSPMFYADKVNTPLLIMHCKDDGAVPFEQGVEWFTALRRLNKPAWMLQYDNGGHQIDNQEDKEDYTKRLMQFFNHYLKNAPAPIWMTQGIPAKLKQIENGYAYDPSGNCGKDCKVCKMWNEKMKKDSVATMAEIQMKAKTENWQELK